MQNASRSLRTFRLRRGWPTKRQKRPKEALANPIRRPSGQNEALDGAKKLQKWSLKGFKRPQKPCKKASGEAIGDHGGSRRLKEGLLEAKNRLRRPAGAQDVSKKPFWCNPFWGPVLTPFRFQKRVQIRVYFWARFLETSGPKK